MTGSEKTMSDNSKQANEEFEESIGVLGNGGLTDPAFQDEFSTGNTEFPGIGAVVYNPTADYGMQDNNFESLETLI